MGERKRLFVFWGREVSKLCVHWATVESFETSGHMSEADRKLMKERRMKMTSQSPWFFGLASSQSKLNHLNILELLKGS